MTRPLPAIIDPIEEAMGQAKPSGSSVRPFVFLLHRRGGLHFFIGRCPGSPIKGTEISGLALTRHGYFKPFSISISKKLRLSTWRQWQSGGSQFSLDPTPGTAWNLYKVISDSHIFLLSEIYTWRSRYMYHAVPASLDVTNYLNIQRRETNHRRSIMHLLTQHCSNPGCLSEHVRRWARGTARTWCQLGRYAVIVTCIRKVKQTMESMFKICGPSLWVCQNKIIAEPSREARAAEYHR